MEPTTPKEWYEMHTKDWNLSIPWESTSDTLKYMWTLAYEEQFPKAQKNSLPNDEE
jgi:hypothetical protein